MKNNYQLDYVDRTILRNQYKILELLSKNFDKELGIYSRNKCRNYVNILEGNYTELFPEIFEGNFELPSKVQKEVFSIIELCDLMDASYLKLPTDEQRGIDEAKVIFNGFSKSDLHYAKIKDFLTAFTNSEEFEDRPLEL